MKGKRLLRPRRADVRQMALGLGSSERYRLFFAALPPAPVTAQIDAVGQRLQAQLGIDSALAMAHVPLYGLGDYDGIPHAVIDAVRNVANLVRAKAFDAVFDALHAVTEPRQKLVLRCGKGLYGFVALQNAIGNALAGAGADQKQFDARVVPHMTLLYGGGKVPESTLDHPIAWHVDRFSLILSLQGHKHYEPYGEWPLQG